MRARTLVRRPGEQESRRCGTLTEALAQITATLLFMVLVMLVVGGVYYLLRRPRVTFWGAVFRWWIVLIAMLLIVVNIRGRLSTGWPVGYLLSVRREQ